MEHLSIRKTDAGFQIEGFPDAVKVIRIEGPKAKRFSDLTLHKADLEFAGECLIAINQVPDQPRVLREALWRAAIIHYMKCFGDSSARFQLSATKIYSRNTLALGGFNYFKDIRRKHIVHDENSYAQGIPGAILNRRDKSYKIEKVVCLSAIAETCEQENYNNLNLLVEAAMAWVIGEADKLCKTLTTELEAVPYDELINREAITYMAPGLDQISKNRNAP